MSGIEILNPPEMGPVLGPYSQVARVRAGTHIYVAGQVGGMETALSPKGSRRNVHRCTPISKWR